MGKFRVSLIDIFVVQESQAHFDGFTEWLQVPTLLNFFVATDKLERL